MTEWWEYKVVDSHISGGQLEADLNKYGKDGWELVGFQYRIDASVLLVFKAQCTE